jgi:glycosyltransferase involved in cell wall biosynthesis
MADPHMTTVDLIVPCFNEGLSLARFFEEARSEISKMPQYEFRIIFIDDGSADDTLKIISGYSAEYENVEYVSFSRNFGKEAAIYAGLKNSTGDCAVVMDADLQHPPSMLGEMLYAIDGEGYDSCSARRVSREGEPRIKSFFSRAFYKLINSMSEVEIIDGAVDFRMMTRQMVNAVLELSEVQRFSKGIFAWVGFKTKWIDFHNVERVAGKSKFSFWKLFKYALEGITAFTTVPLRFASLAGLAISLLSFALIIFELFKTIILGIDSPGYPSTFIMLLLIGGIMLLSCGILGEYLARMYMETKSRPIYIERRTSFRRGDRGAGEEKGDEKFD